MKLIFFSFIILVLSCQDSYSQVRNIIFGMSLNEVILAEGISDYDTEDDEGLLTIYYDGTVGGRDTQISYTFADDNLIEVMYVFLDSFTNENRYIDRYNSLKETLISIYNEPSEDDVLWMDRLYRDSRDRWGFAVSLGHLIYLSEWETDSMEVSHMLFGNNYRINHFVRYSTNDPDLVSLMEDIESEQSRRDF